MEVEVVEVAWNSEMMEVVEVVKVVLRISVEVEEISETKGTYASHPTRYVMARITGGQRSRPDVFSHRGQFYKYRPFYKFQWSPPPVTLLFT